MTERQLRRIINEEIDNIINEEIDNIINEMVDSNNVVDSLIDDSSGIVKKILLELQDYLTDLLMKFKDAFIKGFKREPSIYDMQEFMLMQLYKLTNSIENNLEDDDVVVSINSRYTSKGTTINAIIERDGKQYPFQTDVILAGGYNIQSLHNRYIVKTDLPRTNNNEISNLYKTKMKKLEGVHKIQSEIDVYQKKLEAAKKYLEINSKLTDDEILTIIQSEREYSIFGKWDNLNNYAKKIYIDEWNENNFSGNDLHFTSKMNPKTSVVLTAKEIKNKFKDVQDFYDNYKVKNEILTYIDEWKWQKIHFQKKYIKDYEKNIIKLQNKLNQY